MKDEYKNLAPFYDLLTRFFFLGTLGKAKLFHLNTIKPNSKVLILGGGSGLELEYLLEHYPDIDVDYIEKSTKMMERAQKRVNERPAHKIDFVVSDSVPEGNYDVVITSFFLDLFEEKELILKTKQILRSIGENGNWIVTDFVISSGRHFWQRPLIWIMYCFFRWSTGLKTRHLEDFDRLLLTLGMTKMNENYFFGKFIASRVYINNNILHL